MIIKSETEVEAEVALRCYHNVLMLKCLVDKQLTESVEVFKEEKALSML